MISKNTMFFLQNLSKNNNKDWFTTNKGSYEIAKAEFENFVGALIDQIAKFDPSIAHLEPKDCMFRIHRDVRFSKDKSPYKTHFGAHITAVGKRSEIHSRAGYYIHLGPGETMLAGGAYMPPAPWLNAIRGEIDYNGEALRAIIGSDSFKYYFGEIDGERLVKAPKGYSPDHRDIELLKLKSFLAVHKVADSEVTKPDFLIYAAAAYNAYKPFCDFLNSALD